MNVLISTDHDQFELILNSSHDILIPSQTKGTVSVIVGLYPEYHYSK